MTIQSNEGVVDPLESRTPGEERARYENVLVALRDCDGPIETSTIETIMARSGRDTSELALLLNELQKSGYVVRNRDKGYRLTEKGLAWV